ncbi:hypothetical protein BC939DRAFT_504933 [Gamsiella multidivaricata]|uniref:uncharacterized protein n=1 Tax=Gamsiella multidivaricata TaxID=101098 RepID=UPI00221F0465|nr:uncharacterized protein BC939DRAFT_504933 [Gamsiella multidivaricata]KAI7820511.1 hypothetical protein BC939DRAFT_504933 [Gamsiella multidivaricata]
MNDAHRIVEREILKLETQMSLVFCLDGLPSEEKGPTQVHRENLRKKVVERADKCLRELEVRVDKKLRARKYQFIDIRKHMDSAFYCVYATLGPVYSTWCRIKNDYNRNIPSLGSAIVYKIIKGLDEEDAAKLAKHYLAHNQVMRKNTAQEMFVTSQKVFVNLLQTPVQIGSLPSSSAAAMTYDSLRKQFDWFLVEKSTTFFWA